MVSLENSYKCQAVGILSMHENMFFFWGVGFSPTLLSSLHSLD